MRIPLIAASTFHRQATPTYPPSVFADMDGNIPSPKRAGDNGAEHHSPQSASKKTKVYSQEYEPPSSRSTVIAQLAILQFGGPSGEPYPIRALRQSLARENGAPVTPSPSSSPKTTFLNLSLELRRRIFAHCFRDVTYAIAQIPGGNRGKLPPCQTTFFDAVAKVFNAGYPKHSYLNALTLNKALGEEAYQVLLDQIVFIIAIPIQRQQYSQLVLKYIRPDMSSKLRKLVLGSPSVWSGAIERPWDLTAFPHLKHLDLGPRHLTVQEYIRSHDPFLLQDRGNIEILEFLQESEIRDKIVFTYWNSYKIDNLLYPVMHKTPKTFTAWMSICKVPFLCAEHPHVVSQCPQLCQVVANSLAIVL
jgi:hypothetical protein